MIDEAPRAVFARRLREERTRQALSRRELALMSGVAERALVNYENNVNEAPLGAAYRLAKALDLTLDDLLADHTAPPRPPAAESPLDLLALSLQLQERALIQLRRSAST